MTAEPVPAEQQRTAEDILADLLDTCEVVDRQQPCHRYISTERIRQAITHGWAAA